MLERRNLNNGNTIKTQDFLKIFQSTAGIPTVELLKCESGGNGSRHTWVIHSLQLM